MFEDSKKVENIFGRLIGLAAKEFRRCLEKNLQLYGHDLNSEQMIVLGNIYHKAGLTQQQIADLIAINKTAATRLIDSLESKKLVVRVSDKEDRRQNTIYLTESGKDKCRQIRKVVTKTEEEMTKGIPKNKVKICKEVLKQVRINLNYYNDKE